MDHKPALRVCPRFAFSFEDIRRPKYNCHAGYPICDHASCILGGAPALKHVFGDYIIYKRHYLTMVSTLRWPGKSEVEQLLDVYDIPICPHLTLGHSYVVGAYRPWENVFENRCSYCDTHFEFSLLTPCTFDRAMPGAYCLDVVVTRNLGELDYPTDPKWLSQLCVTNEPDLTCYWLNNIILWHNHEIDKRKRARGNISCGGSGGRCRFKAQIKESENILQQGTQNIWAEAELQHSGLWQEFPYTSSPSEVASSYKGSILFKPLRISLVAGSGPWYVIILSLHEEPAI